MNIQIQIFLDKGKKILREVLLFLSSRIFIRHFIAIIAVTMLLFYAVFSWMGMYTHHLESYEVDSFVGMSLEEAKEAAKAQKLTVVVNDSIFKVGSQPHVVLEQNPEPQTRVKKNRTIYLVITKKQPDLLLLPDLRGGNDDYSRYKKKAERMEFKTKVKEERLDEQLAPNTILHVYLDGKEITEELNKGFRAIPGDTLEFVVSKRQTDMVPIPYLICKRFDAARFLVHSYQLTLGDVFEDAGVSDPELAYVYKQEPLSLPDSTLLAGSAITVYLSDTLPAGCPTEDNIYQSQQ